MTVRILTGDALERLRTLPDASVDAIVTDPPSGIAFMGMEWDEDKGGRQQWVDWLAGIMREAFRVAKPGAHAVVWALPRTSHWTALALEDAGFEIRDSLHHVFGSGFPKSLNVGRAIDMVDGVAMTREAQLRFTGWLRATGVTAAAVNEATSSFMASHYLSANEQPAIPTRVMFEAIRPLLGGQEVPDWVEELVEARSIGSENVKKRPVTGERLAADFLNARPVSVAAQGLERTGRRVIQDTTAFTDEAKPWHGWGTALKPAHEVWWLARKPVSGTVAGNVLAYGTGALNVGKCIVPAAGGSPAAKRRADSPAPSLRAEEREGRPNVDRSSPERYAEPRPGEDLGRWPANFVLTHDVNCPEGGACVDGCPVAELDAQSGTLKSGVIKAGTLRSERSVCYGAMPDTSTLRDTLGDAGGASRFFPVFRYEAKPPRSERENGLPEAGLKEEDVRTGMGGEMPIDDAGAERDRFAKRARNVHPTVKPVALMSWLLSLVTPPGGVVLDPFLGSGTTAIAAQRLNIDCIGIEREPAYVRISEARIRGDQPLFSRVVVE